MTDFDLLVVNVMIALTKGDFPNALYTDHRYTKVGVETTLNPNGRPPFPTDVLCFSRRNNHFLLIETKDTTTTELDSDQAQSYQSLDGQSFRDLGHRFEEDQLGWDAAYIGHEENIDHLKGQIATHGIVLPLLMFDRTIMKITLIDPNKFAKGYLNGVFEEGIQLPMDGPGKVTKYVNFSATSSYYDVLLAVVPNLLAPEFATHARYSELAAKSHSSITGLWDGMARGYKRELESLVKKSLQALRDNGLNELTITDSHCSLDISDSKGKFSPQKAQSIRNKIERAQAVLRSQQGLF